HEPERGHEHEQQREQRDERGMAEAGDKLPSVVVTVFLDHPDDERGWFVTLLPSVDPADGALRGVHRHRPPPPPTAPEQAQTATLLSGLDLRLRANLSSTVCLDVMLSESAAALNRRR